MLNIPVLVRSPKSSSIGPGQYLDGRPLLNTGCCRHFVAGVVDNVMTKTWRHPSLNFFLLFLSFFPSSNSLLGKKYHAFLEERRRAKKRMTSFWWLFPSKRSLLSTSYSVLPSLLHLFNQLPPSPPGPAPPFSFLPSFM